MRRFLKRHGLWVAYFAFLALALAFGATERPLDFTTGPASGKVALGLIFMGFLGYSLFAHVKEAFFRSVAKINQFHWGRQIGVDLYISVTLSLCLIYMVDGPLALLFWLIPVLIFANLAILPYLILNYGAVLSGFAA